MSIQDEINRINENIANTYSALSDMGATIPGTQNSDNLANTARTVPQASGGGEDEVVWVTCFLDLYTMRISGMSHLYEDLAPLVGKKVMKVVVDYGYGICVGDWAVKNGTYALMSQVMIRSDLGAGLGLYYFCIELRNDNTVSIDPRIIDSVSLGG